MGMYTELVLNVEIKRDTPSEVIEMIEPLAGSRLDCPDVLPNHEFFRTDRWGCVLTMSSYYFTPFPCTKFERDGDYYLSTRFDLKNYDDEIDKFVDWLFPHLEVFEGGFLGYKRYEEDDNPTLLYAGKEGPDWREVSF